MAAKTAMDLVIEARACVTNLGVEDVEREIAQGDVLLVDLREPAERAQHGAIPGALHVPRGMLEFQADPKSPYHLEELRPSRRTILHCATGGRSALAAQTLQILGYEDVAHLDGGLTAWLEAGRSVVKVGDGR